MKVTTFLVALFATVALASSIWTATPNTPRETVSGNALADRRNDYQEMIEGLVPDHVVFSPAEIEERKDYYGGFFNSWLDFDNEIYLSELVQAIKGEVARLESSQPSRNDQDTADTDDAVSIDGLLKTIGNAMARIEEVQGKGLLYGLIQTVDDAMARLKAAYNTAIAPEKEALSNNDDVVLTELLYTPSTTSTPPEPTHTTVQELKRRTRVNYDADFTFPSLEEVDAMHDSWWEKYTATVDAISAAVAFGEVLSWEALQKGKEHSRKEYKDINTELYGTGLMTKEHRVSFEGMVEVLEETFMDLKEMRDEQKTV